MEKAAAEVWKYCDPENHELKQALAAHYGIAPDNIVVGEGIDGLFGYVVRLFVEPGVTVATSLGAYPTFNFHVDGFGGRLVTTPYVNDREDPDSLLDLAKRENARLIYFANPDNPMGSWWDAAEVQRLIDRVPESAVLCLDEAYGEFAPEGTMPPLDVTNPRVLRFRTFSKAYGMAGLRIGYAIGEASLIKAFDKIRNHFGVNRIAQAGAAGGAGRWGVSGQVSSKRRRRPRPHRRHRARQRPDAAASAANFVTIDCGRDGSLRPRRPEGADRQRTSSCACPAWRRWTAASASAPAPPPTSPPSPKPCPRR